MRHTPDACSEEFIWSCWNWRRILINDPERDDRSRETRIRHREDDARGMGLGLWLAILAVIAVSSLYFFGFDRSGTVATDDRPAGTTPSTTGSGTIAPETGARDGLKNSGNIPGATPPTLPDPTPR